MKKFKIQDSLLGDFIENFVILGLVTIFLALLCLPVLIALATNNLYWLFGYFIVIPFAATIIDRS